MEPLRVAGEIARPASVCRALLVGLDAAEGRRRRRQRDTTPDAIGLAVKRELLERVVAEDPPPETFEQWLLERAAGLEREGHAGGAVAAMARDIFDEWRLFRSEDHFREWLAHGAPSEDAFQEDTKSQR